MSAETRFLITSPARASSTSLRETLNAIPGTLCHGEILAPARVLGISSKIEAAGLNAGMRNLDKPGFYARTLHPQGITHLGFKLLYHQFFSPMNGYYTHRFLSQKPKVVFIWRRDLVRRFQSECRLRLQIGQWTEDRYSAITETAVANDCIQQMEMAGWVRNQLKLYGIGEVLDIDFEDLITDPGVIGRVVSFLGIDAGMVELGQDARTEETKKAGAQPPDAPGFDAPALERYRDVSLNRALDFFTRTH